MVASAILNVVASESFIELDHTADVALRAYGRDLAELLANAAAGMITLAGIEAEPGPGVSVDIHLSATDAESLLVTWLEEILSQAEVEHTLLKHYSLRVIDSTRLEGNARAMPIRSVTKVIKAVTFHRLEILPTGTGLEVTVVFDV